MASFLSRPLSFLATAALIVAGTAARQCVAQVPQHGQENQGPAQFDFPDVDPQDVVIPASSAALPLNRMTTCGPSVRFSPRSEADRDEFC